LTQDSTDLVLGVGRMQKGRKILLCTRADLSLPVARDDRRNMRLILRLLGTWLVGIALILLIIDGTKSLGANAIVVTSLGETWTSLHSPSLEQLRAFLASRFFGPLLDIVVTAVLTFPSWLVLGVPGIFIAWLGRSKRIRVFVKQDHL
jgi:hypothetical protein